MTVYFYSYQTDDMLGSRYFAIPPRPDGVVTISGTICIVKATSRVDDSDPKLSPYMCAYIFEKGSEDLRELRKLVSG